MTGCWVELQLEKTELAWPWSDRDTVSEAEQSGGRDSLQRRCHWVIRIRSHLGRISSTLRVWPGDTLHLHSAAVWRIFIKTLKIGHL